MTPSFLGLCFRLLVSTPSRSWISGGLCQQIRCMVDADCQKGGDTSASCDLSSGACDCQAPYHAAPTPAFCYLTKCTSDAMCRAGGDKSAYCKDDGNCRCDWPPYRNHPTTAYCEVMKLL